MNKKIIVSSVVILIVVVIGFVWWQGMPTPAPKYTGPVEKIRMGVETSLLPATVWVAENKGYFLEQGLDAEIKEFSSGRAALKSMLEEGNLDLATVAQTPVMFNSFNRSDYAIIAGMVSSSNDVKILVRKDRNISTPADLRGKKIGMTQGSTGHYFLSLFLTQHGLTLADVITVDIAATTLPQAIVEGKVDAISTWEPNINNAKNALGDNALLLESRDVFREDFYFVTFKDWATAHPELLKRFLAAIDRAALFIADHPAEAQQIVAQRLKLDPLFVSSIWSDFSFKLFLDQAILSTIERESRWAIANKLTDKTAPSNYLDFIYFDALEAVKPEAITIIH